MKKPNSKKNVEKKDTSLTLSDYITIFIFVIMIIITSILFGYVFSILKDSKSKDTTAIMFLQLEKYSQTIRDRVTLFEKKLELKTDEFKNLSTADIILIQDNMNDFSRKKGDIKDKLNLTDFGLENVNQIKDSFFIQISGVNFYARKFIVSENNTRFYELYLWKIDAITDLQMSETIGKENTVFLLNREFKIIYANSPKINEDNLMSNELIKNFIKSPIKTGQIKFEQNKELFYGFYSEIPDSNVIIFSQIPSEVITSHIMEILKSFAFGVFIILGFGLILAKLLLPILTRPIKELVELTKRISSGDFKIKTQTKGFGELSLLLTTFTEMGKKLENRDQQIIGLMDDKMERDRLDREILIAKKIQENFLPSKSEKLKAGIKVETFYKPAEEVAGDWYHQFYDLKTDEFISILVDVSGHGAGSSMFTAVIASSFEQFKIRRGENYTVFDFLNDINHVLLKLGKKDWFATLIMGIVSADRKNLRVINCGHLFPFVLQMKSGKTTVKSPSMPSSPIGLFEELKYDVKDMVIDTDTSILFFTDGIIEQTNSQNKPFKRKGMSKICEEMRDIKPQQVLETLVSKHTLFCKGEKQNDDICVYALGISAPKS